MDEVGVADAIPERLVLVGVGEGVGVGEALHDGDEDPETVGGRQHDQQLVEVPAMDQLVNSKNIQGSAKFRLQGCVKQRWPGCSITQPRIRTFAEPCTHENPKPSSVMTADRIEEWI